jgi:hypothetical protein
MDPFGDGQLVTAGWEGDVLVHDYMTGKLLRSIMGSFCARRSVSKGKRD